MQLSTSAATGLEPPQGRAAERRAVKRTAPEYLPAQREGPARRPPLLGITVIPAHKSPAPPAVPPTPTIFATTPRTVPWPRRALLPCRW